MIIKKNNIFKILTLFLIPFILSILLTNASEENEINSINKTNHNLKNLYPIPIINRTLSKEYNHLFIIPRLKLGTCLIGKTGSSISIMIFCYLKKKKNNMNPKDFKLCGYNRKYYNNLKHFEKTYGVKKFNRLIKRYNFVIFVRNPIERLISGFMHLCYNNIKKENYYCNECKKNFTCFVNILEKRLWQILNHNRIPYTKHKEFVYNYHFYPQTWSCDYYKHHKEFTYIKYNSSDKESFSNNIAKILSNSHVSNETSNFIKKMINDVKTDHITFSQNETTIYKNMLYNDSLLLQKVCSIYYFDFIQFGFEFPEKCKNKKIIK